MAEQDDKGTSQDQPTATPEPAQESSRSAMVSDLAGKAKTWASGVVGAASGFVSQVISGRPWVPATDICTTTTELVILADLPGVEPANLKTSATAKAVTITGALAKPDLLEDAEWVQRGRNQGAFEKVIELPREIRSAEIQAKFRRGVLELRAPLAVPGAVKTTEVKVEATEDQ